MGSLGNNDVKYCIWLYFFLGFFFVLEFGFFFLLVLVVLYELSRIICNKFLCFIINEINIM